MKHLKRTIFTALLCLTLGTAAAQTSSRTLEPGQLFEEGRSLFSQKAYTAAIGPLQKYLNETDKAGIGSEALGRRLEAEYMLVSVCYETSHPNRANLLQTYLDQHPDSPHEIGRAHV